MPLINVRDLLAFPPGNNPNDTIVSGVHFNLTTLQYWNYTYYSNGTFSNGSNCFLSFDPYTPALLANGTFLNSTSCYSPILPLGPRADAGIGFGVFFAFSIMFTFINLRKHGRLFLPNEKRFRAIGRRWQWYWMLFVAACGMISAFTGVDVDRYYVSEAPIVLYTIFWMMMLPSTMASVWESVRHWGSWQERQMIDPNSFILSQDDRRGKTEFYMPLVFYLFAFLNFFMSVPRGWSDLEEQRSPDQTATVAEPLATDGRFKAGGFFLFLSWLVILFSLRHSIHHYKPQNRGPIRSFVGIIRHTPVKFMLTLPLALVMVGYVTASAFLFSISPLNIAANPAWIFGLGWTPIALIFIIHEIFGYIEPNEDRELIRQRRVRGEEIDRELGFTKKPGWWRLAYGDNDYNVHSSIAKNVRELGGGAATTKNLESSIEMGNMPPRDTDRKLSTGTIPRKHTDKTLATGNNPAWRASQRREERLSKTLTPEATRIAELLLAASGAKPTPDKKEDPFADIKAEERAQERGRLDSSGSVRTRTSERSTSTASGVTLNAPPQKVRSMLDI